MRSPALTRSWRVKSYFFPSGHLLALVLLDLIGPSRSHAAFGSRRGKLSHSHDTVRSETRNKRGFARCVRWFFVLRVLGSHRFSEAVQFVSFIVAQRRLNYSVGADQRSLLPRRRPVQSTPTAVSLTHCSICFSGAWERAMARSSMAANMSGPAVSA